MNQFFFVSMKEPRLECSITELLYVREFFSQKKVYEKKNLDVSLWLTVNRPVVLLLPAYSYLAGDLVMSASILSAGQGLSMGTCRLLKQINTSLFVWLVADGWCWFVLREKYCWLVAGGWFVVREKYCWLVADKPSEQAEG
jgi:hypothetical protein